MLTETPEKLSNHSLMETKMKFKCSELLEGLQTHQHGWVFNCPVDPVELGLPDYFDIIKKPMDLGTVQKKLDSDVYHSIDEFASDVRLTFDNATTYCADDGSPVGNIAKELKTRFEGDLKKLMVVLDSEDREPKAVAQLCAHMASLAT